MKKNWILFIIIVVSSYAWLLIDSSKKTAEFKKEQAAYEERKAAYDAAQAEKEKEREANTARLKELIKPSDTTTPTESGVPSMSALPDEDSPRALLRRMGDPSQAPLHVIETPLYRVVLSELGAVPIDWEIKSSEFVTNISEDDETATTTTVPMIPQFPGGADRSYPLQFTGSTVREFNTQMYSVNREAVEGGTRLTFTSDPLEDGLIARKEFYFPNDTYVVNLHLTIENPVSSKVRQRLGNDPGIGIGWEGGFGNPTVMDRVHGNVEAIYSSQGKIAVRTLKRGEPPYDITNKVDWAGHERKFFAEMLIPSPQNPPQLLRVEVTKNAPEEFFQKGVSPPLDVVLFHASQDLEPGGIATLDYQLFVGPKSREALSADHFVVGEKASMPGDLVFHRIPLGMGFLRWLCLRLLDLMRWLHDKTGVWGLAIIITTLIVRIIIYPITHWSIKNTARTMVEQEKIRPELAAINKKFKSDPMKRNQAMMALYREHNINPVAGPLRGCLPALLQMPIFLALYVLFEQAVELRGQSYLWIDDLSRPDALIHWGADIPLIGSSLNILPIIMGFTNYFLMAIMRMPAADETQEKIQRQMTFMMPVMMVFFLYHMPAGLTLYWTVSNIFSIAQSMATKRLMVRHKEEHAARLAQKDGTKKGTNDVAVEASSTTIR